MWHPASNTLTTAKSDLSYAQAVLAGGSTPQREQAATDVQLAVDEAQAALDAVQHEMDRLTAIFADTQAAAVAAAQAIANHLMAAADIDSFTVTTDSEGKLTVPTYYCAGAGDANGDRWVVTETAVPVGVDPAGVDSELVLSTGYGNHVETAGSGVDRGVYTGATFTQESAYSGTWAIDAVNTLLSRSPRRLRKSPRPRLVPRPRLPRP